MISRDTMTSQDMHHQLLVKKEKNCERIKSKRTQGTTRIKARTYTKKGFVAKDEKSLVKQDGH